MEKQKDMPESPLQGPTLVPLLPPLIRRRTTTMIP